MGLHDEENNLAVEQMMQGFFRAAGIMLRINDRLLQRFEEQLAPKSAPVPVAPASSCATATWHDRCDAPAAGHGRGTGAVRGVVDAGLRAACTRKRRARWPNRCRRSARIPQQPVEVRERFIQLLSSPKAVPMLKRMARIGVLARYLPEFGQVAGRMQYDLFHVYTVDQHTLTVLRLLEQFLRGEQVPGFSIPPEVVARCASPSCCCSPACSTTSPRAGAATTRCSAPRTCAASPTEHACPAPTSSCWPGWCASTC
jgi:[protein-PII] uridylyltransferase